jgi:hypothetical protein
MAWIIIRGRPWRDGCRGPGDSVCWRTTRPPSSAPCPVSQGLPQCAETDPFYLASGALSYAIQQTSEHDSTSAVTTSLVTWRDGRLTTLHVFAAPLTQRYGMSAHGQAIWIGSPTSTGGSWPIWCWSGGPVTRITALPAADAPASVAR